MTPGRRAESMASALIMLSVILLSSRASRFGVGLEASQSRDSFVSCHVATKLGFASRWWGALDRVCVGNAGVRMGHSSVRRRLRSPLVTAVVASGFLWSTRLNKTEQSRFSPLLLQDFEVGVAKR